MHGFFSECCRILLTLRRSQNFTIMTALIAIFLNVLVFNTPIDQINNSQGNQGKVTSEGSDPNAGWDWTDVG
mgnify:CR=1 FL=1